MKSISILFFSLFLGVTSQTALASDSDPDCPVGLLNGMTLDDEFGPGTAALTRCISKRDQVKVVYQINQQCKNSACTKPYAIGNIINAINDYEITHGMSADEYEIVAVVHSGGWPLILNNDAGVDGSGAPTGTRRHNNFQPEMEALLAKGVRVVFCQNTARSKGVRTDDLIPGVEYVTAGVTALADYQALGYSFVQP